MKKSNVLNKQSMVCFIGSLGKSKTTKHQHYFEAYYNVVANESMHNDDDISIQDTLKTTMIQLP